MILGVSVSSRLQFFPNSFASSFFSWKSKYSHSNHKLQNYHSKYINVFFLFMSPIADLGRISQRRLTHPQKISWRCTSLRRNTSKILATFGGICYGIKCFFGCCIARSFSGCFFEILMVLFRVFSPLISGRKHGLARVFFFNLKQRYSENSSFFCDTGVV